MDDETRFEALRLKRRNEALTRLEFPTLVTLAGSPFLTPPTMRAAGIDFERLTRDARALVRCDGDDDECSVSLEGEALGESLALVQQQEGVAIEILARAGHQIAALEEKPPLLMQWATLAQSLRDGVASAGERLLEMIRDHCDRNELGQATGLLEAATPLARIVGGQFAVSVRVGRHRIEREFRIARDRKHLSFFVGRDEAMVAFNALLADDGPWALHYVGVGGAGKTTFIRHLAIEQARDRNLSVARIDFDYLSPAYPGRDPGQLVQAIIHELTVHIERAEQDRWSTSITEQLARLREVARETTTTNPLGPIDWPEFGELLSFVASFLQSFAHPVIVLDTCEELMKLPSVGGRIPSVEATFRLIERLHEMVPKLRVIFAGRRLITHGGAGWVAGDAQAQPLSEARPYLAMHELRGMTKGEAEQVFDKLLPDSRQSDLALRAKILDKCPEDSRVIGVAAEIPGDPARFSPFRIVRYARWISAEPTLGVEQLDAGADPYIEQRIVQRMGALEDLLPTIVILRRLDAAMLAAVRSIPLSAAEATINELAGHEWIYAFDSAERGTIVEAKSSVRDQLEAYLIANQPGAWARAKHAIGEAFEPRLGDPDPMSLPVELVDAALRSMEEVPGVRAWLALERRIGADWSSALNLVRFLAGSDDPARKGGLWSAAIRATELSALIHEQPETDVTEGWTAIIESMAELERIDHVRMLAARATFGWIAAAGWAGTEPAETLGQKFERALDEVNGRPQIAATWVVAAFEGFIERLERDYSTCPSLERLAKGLWWNVFRELSPALTAWVLILRARAWALLHRPDVVVEMIGEALGSTSFDLLPNSMDWLQPSSLLARIRLESVRLGMFDTVGTPRHRDWWPETIETEDHDRLWSALATGTPEPSPLPKYGRPFRNVGLRVPSVYRRFGRASFVSELRRWDAKSSEATLTPVEELRVRFMRARRTRDPKLVESGVTSTSVDQLFVEASQAAAIVLERCETISATKPSEVIEQWSYQRAITSGELNSTVDAMRPHIGNLSEFATRKSLDGEMAALTLEEVSALSRYTKKPLAVKIPQARELVLHPDQTTLGLRIAVRRFAKDRTGLRDGDFAATHPYNLALAQIAFDEAELLSLRFPDRAIRLFDFAHRLYTKRNEPALASAAELGKTECERVLGKLGPTTINGGAPTSTIRIERGTPREPALASRFRLQWKTAVRIAPLVLGIGLGLAILYGMWVLGDRVVAPFVRRLINIPNSGWVSAIYFVLLAGLIYMLTVAKPISQRLTSWLREHWPWRYRPAVALSATREGKVVARIRLPKSEVKMTAKIPALGTIPEWTDDAMAKLRGALKAEDRTVLVPIDVTRALQAHAWEVPFVATMKNVVVWRPVSRTREPETMAESYLDPDITAAWAKVPAPLGIAHLIGRPRRRIGGIDLEGSLREGALARDYDKLDVILQLSPQELDQASVATRTEMGLLRELAATLMERGARSVIVLPAISRHDIVAMVKTLARVLGSDPERPLHTLANGIRALRDRLSSSNVGDHAAIANEVTLLFLEASD